MKKIIAMVILVVMVIMGTAFAEDTIEMKNRIDPALNHHFIDCTKDYKAFVSGRKLRNDIDSAIGTVTGWCANAATDTANFVTDRYNDCTNAVTNITNDIGDTASLCWNCACGFIDGLFS